MGKAKDGIAADGREMHYSVGAIIQYDGKYLLMDRAIPPLGFSGIAGHLDVGETSEEAIIREVKEESGLTVLKAELLYEEEIDWNWCSLGVQAHYWYLFDVTVTSSHIQPNHESKSMDWYTAEEIKQLSLEKVWAYWLKKIIYYVVYLLNTNFLI